VEHNLRPHIGRLHLNIGRAGQTEGGGAGEEDAGVSMKMRGRYTTRRESSGAGYVGDQIVPDCRRGTPTFRLHEVRWMSEGGKRQRSMTFMRPVKREEVEVGGLVEN
jgi:hypothetical protein